MNASTLKLFNTYLGTKTAEKSEPKMTESEGEVLVKKVPKKFAHSVVGPPPVDQEKSFEEFELGDRVIRGQDCLHSFLSADTDADVRSCK